MRGFAPGPPAAMAAEDAAQPAPRAEGEEGPPPLAAAGSRRPHWVVVAIFLILLVGALAYARAFLMPVMLAFILALVFSPVRRFLDRRGLPSGVSALTIVATLLAGLAVGLLLLVEPAQDWAREAPEIGRELDRKLRDLIGSAQAVMEAGEQVDGMATAAEEDVQQVVVQEPSYLASFAMQTPEVAGQVLFVLVLLLFILASGDMFYEKIVHVAPTFKDKRRAMRIAFDVERKLSRYLFTITLINAGLGVAVGTAMWALDMPNAPLFGVLAFALNFIPYIGALGGVALAGITGLVTFDELGRALAPAAAYLALTSLEGQIVTPWFVGRRLKMNTVAIFIAVAFWAWLWSLVGMLLAVPLLVATRAFCEHIPSLRPVGDFLSARGAEAEEDEEDAAA
jgi:predicted PurR-regulated permease PerM